MVGDVDFCACQPKMFLLSHLMPGGVGPMTVCALDDQYLKPTIDLFYG
ncbi:MAG: hypothetical protein IPP42_22920 [Saprospiraceae bacterium]|nr:hypothetical protein [Saprospiraceae bacterium]